MNNEIVNILQAVKNGDVSIDDAALKLKMKPFEDIDYAKIDFHRKIRNGVPEIIYGSGKTAEQITGIIKLMLEKEQDTILVTRLSEEKYLEIKKTHSELQYNKDARIGYMGQFKKPDGIGKIIVATGGTSDIPVAEEAAVVAEALGNDVLRLYDVGVAGLHRLLSYSEDLMSASVIIAIAGMEGALASVIGGLVDCPVIAVPTSIGYGTAFNGLAALLSMLNSCASGISVVNIDNGFGAAFMANMINHMGVK